MFRSICILLPTALLAMAASTTASANEAVCRVDAASQAAHPPLTDGRPAARDVTLRVHVDADGRITGPADDNRDGSLAMNNARRWRYTCPGNAGGVAEVRMTLPASACRIREESRRVHIPMYPSTLRGSDAVGGAIIIGLAPTGTGGLGQARVATSSGVPALDEAALKAVSRWRFDCVGSAGPRPPEQEVRIGFDVN